ncbi:MAG: glycoside hydrolase family 97 catalytic domain-containing protein [Bacteroidales bacterium]
MGKIIPKGEYHHGQWMVNHYRRVLETAAKYQIAVDAHEPIKATGIRRTLPNAVSREGLRGQEFNAWAKDGGNPPEHLPLWLSPARWPAPSILHPEFLISSLISGKRITR